MRFVFCGKPPKSNSNGLQAFFDLCIAIKRLGFVAEFIPFAPDGAGGYIPIKRSQVKGSLPSPYMLYEDYVRDDLDVAVYSETFPGNFLDLEHVIRYYGNRVGYCSATDPRLGPHEYKLCHSRQIMDKPDFVVFYINSIKLSQFQSVSPSTSRTLEVTYDGKGALYGPTPRVPNTLGLSREWPKSNEETLQVLRACKTLYTYDSFTQLIVEAALLGALPVVMRSNPWTLDELRSSELTELYFVSLNEFEAAGDKKDLYSRVEAAREALVNQVQLLQDSWLPRVFDFIGHARAHFGIR